MSMEAAQAQPLSRFEQIRYAREVLRVEGQAVLDLADRLGESFTSAVQLILRCQGNVIVSGVGKAGLVGQKIVATLASTGTGSHFLHPGEAVHGDLGRVAPRDLLLMLSYSGETEEIVRLLPSLRAMGLPLLAITSKQTSSLGRHATVTLPLGPLQEACSLGLAPSTSTAVMMALGDALALVVSRQRNFDRDDFARYHPGGSLGRKLANVEDVMRSLGQCRIAYLDQSVRHVLVSQETPRRRTGAIMLIDRQGCLRGVFTDSDLARLIARQTDVNFDQAISEVMTRSPKTVPAGAKLSDAIELLDQYKISELPVVDPQGKPIGLIDVTDVIGLLPGEPVARVASPSTNLVNFDGPTTVLFRTQQEGGRVDEH